MNCVSQNTFWSTYIIYYKYCTGTLGGSHMMIRFDFCACFCYGSLLCMVPYFIFAYIRAILSFWTWVKKIQECSLVYRLLGINYLGFPRLNQKIILGFFVFNKFFKFIIVIFFNILVRFSNKFLFSFNWKLEN